MGDKELIIMPKSEPLAHVRIGRPPRFKEPSELLVCLAEYAQWCIDNPLQIEQSTKDGIVTINKQRPLTLDGLCLWCNILTPWATFKHNASRRDNAEEFDIVINACEAAIRNQQVTGAMVGLFSERLVARLNGISDKIDLNADVKVKPAMSYEEFCEQCRVDEAKSVE